MKGLRHRVGRAEIVAKIASLDAKIRASPNDPQLVLQRATLKFLDLQLHSSLVDLDAFLVNNPTNVSALVMKGKIHSFLDQYDQADETFKIALVWRQCFNSFAHRAHSSFLPT